MGYVGLRDAFDVTVQPQDVLGAFLISPLPSSGPSFLDPRVLFPPFFTAFLPSFFPALTAPSLPSVGLSPSPTPSPESRFQPSAQRSERGNGMRTVINFVLLLLPPSLFLPSRLPAFPRSLPEARKKRYPVSSSQSASYKTRRCLNSSTLSNPGRRRRPFLFNCWNYFPG